jgi:pyruvate/2-oxoglutarate dehydrogenase complex dihydrolipoamide dehydrogenase (E3) component
VGLDPEARSIPVDDNLRAADGVWAVGDITGKGDFTHVAVYQGRIAAADLLDRSHAPADYSAVPRVTFTDPEVASVGLSEKQAREAGIEVAVGMVDTSSSARGFIHGPGAEHGVYKLIADARAGVLVGASIMGPAAGEVLGTLVLAVKEKVAIERLRQLIYPYPTFVRGLEDALRQLG